MRESKANTILNQYLRAKRIYCYYELKVARGDRFYFSAIEDHQDEGLPVLEERGLVWKFSDEDSRRKPCDGASLPPLPSYLVIRYGTEYMFIPYSVIKSLRAKGEKSLTRNEALFWAQKVMHT